MAAAGTTYVSGNICGASLRVTWQNSTTWVMYGNTTVPTTCILTIAPGTAVKVDPLVHLYINGQLQANGTSTSYITFDVNKTGEIWGGLQFNKSSRVSYLQYASLRSVDVGVRAVQNPLFAGPTIGWDLIDHANIGVHFDGSSGSLWWTRINDTRIGVLANSSGSPVIAANTITAVTGSLAVGIYATNLASPDIASNMIRWVNGSNGAPGVALTPRGADGSSVIGILVNGSASPNVAGNTIDQVRGGRGGNGYSNPAGNGGRGGNGGGAAGIAVASSGVSRVQNSFITNVYGGHGGDGGTGSGSSFSGGYGGSGGSALALENINDTTQGWWFYNTATGLVGGSAGNGGAGSALATTGHGGAGGDAYGFFLIGSANGNASNDVVQTVRGGYGGNGSVGGLGGQAAGITFLGVDGSALLGTNTISGLTAGPGGGGTTAGVGGNATGVVAFGSENAFNLTTMTSNQVSSLAGGIGGVGGAGGGAGGTADGLAAYHVRLTTATNQVQTITGGQGGSTGPGKVVGQSGTATGLAAALILSGNSSSDRIQSITRGALGTGGTPAPATYGIGFLNLGTAATKSTFGLANVSFSSIGDYELYLENYTSTTALNTTFSSSQLAVMSAANLTVQNFLAVTAFWPNNSTLVTRAVVTVSDNAVPIFNRVIPSGAVRWIRVTNRVYVDKTVASWNTTRASVAFGSYSFANNPRTVNLTASLTQYFTMIDGVAPTSSANPLPGWTGTRSFTIHYTYSDGNGTGVSNITLWSNLNGTGWVQSGIAIPSGTGTGSFLFNAPADGTYQFATTAYDRAGNHQSFPPSANNTWTIVDTAIPVSAVSALPTFETSLSFTVNWGPVGSETDIAFYVIQYLHGTTWTTWLGDTTLRSQLFNITALGIASPQGAYAFRSLAHTFAGLIETKTANDTWTIVDTIPPSSAVNPLSRYQTATSFGVTWAPTGGTADIATYAVQVSTDGGAWTTWFAGATNTSAIFAGRDGHEYAFRSLATDNAGNIESKTGNDTWTVVDTTAPVSAISLLPRYETTTALGIAWAPGVGTTDAVSYAIQVGTDGGAWTTWFSGAVNRSATFTGRDGHVYAFRSLATDAAGNVESKTGNDTWTIVDTTAPFVVSDAPEGSGVAVSPTITVTFDEPMDEASVVQAFSITPSINGNFSWNTAGTVVTFTPARSLQAGTPYVIYIATTAKDLAGNSLAQPRTFGFTTAGSPPGAGTLSVDPLWLLVVAVAVASLAAAIFLLRRRSAADTAQATEAPKPAAPSPPPEIDDVFLLYKDGILIKHETLRLRPDIDTDILSGMLTAVQQFVKDSFQSEDEGELNEITVGQMHLHIGRGKWLILAARVAGGDVATMNEQIRKAIQDMEDHQWDQLEDWDGDMGLARVLAPYLKKLIRGDYVA